MGEGRGGFRWGRGEEILDGGGGLPSFPFSPETPDTQVIIKPTKNFNIF